MAVSKVILNGNTLIDATTATATAADIIAPLTAMLANGVMTTGTGSSGGGLEYETGTYSPSSDVVQPTIPFNNTHTNRPFFTMIYDVSFTVATENSSLFWSLMSWYDLDGSYFKPDNSTTTYARAQYTVKSSSAATYTGSNITSLTANAGTGMPFWLSNTAFKPVTTTTISGSERCWRSGRTYKWIAIWKSET